MASSVEATREELKRVAQGVGIKDVGAKAKLTGPATLDNLQSQMLELKDLVENVKALVSKEEEIKVESWIEK